jgi:hypothetical protein
LHRPLPHENAPFRPSKRYTYLFTSLVKAECKYKIRIQKRAAPDLLTFNQ